MGAILVAAIVISMSLTYAFWSEQTAQRQVMSVIDIMRAAEKRQKQLLSLTYAYKDGEERVHLYIYNYGSEASTVSKLFIGAQNVTASVYGITLPPKSGPHELEFPCHVSGQADVLLITQEGGSFVWRVNL